MTDQTSRWKSGKYPQTKEMIKNFYTNAILQRVSKNLLFSLKISVRTMSEAQKEPHGALAAICHMRSTNDKQHNMQQVEKIVQEAKNSSVKFLFVPECCDFVGEHRKQTLELAEPLTGQTVQNYKKLAQNNSMWISFGGIHESILNSKGEKTDKIYNTHIVINDVGEIVATYRKLHLFDVVTPEFKFRESDVVRSGAQIVEPIETPIGVVGLQICYDIRFPEVSTILRKKGAQILTYPSAFAYSTGKAHWEVLLRARAIENQCFVIAPAQIGFHNKKRQSFGRGMIVDPWGKIIAECKEEDLDVAVAEINVSNTEKVRGNMPCFDHRRSDVYSLIPIEMANTTASEDYAFGECTIPKDTIFYVSEYSYAFTNIRCVVPGHVLIATKRRVERMIDLTKDEISDLYQTACKVQRIIEKIHNATATTMTIQDGEDAGQTVKHVHVHVMPRKKGDFEFNDQIYIELNKHDHAPEDGRRPIETMIAEAKLIRSFF